MVLESDFKHYYLGTTSLYQELDVLSRGHPVFLHRNIRDSLYYKQQELTRADTRLSTRSQSRAALTDFDFYAEAMSARDVANWYPRADEIKQFEQTPTLIILPVEVLLKGTTPNAGSNAKDATLDWLPMSGSQRLQCEIECHLLYSPDAFKEHSGHIKGAKKRPAYLNCSKDAHGNAHVDIEMDAPFVFSETALIDFRDSMEAKKNKSTDVALRSDPLDLNQFGLRLKLACTRGSTARDLFRLLHNEDINSESTLAPKLAIKGLEGFPNGGKLALLQTKVPTSPARETTDGSASSESNSQEKYQMRIEMKWTNPKPKGSVLETIRGEKDALSKLTSNTTAGAPEVAPKQYEITYVFAGANGETRSLLKKSLHCPWCITRLAQSSFEYLHFHLLTCHDYFKFTTHEESEHEGVIYKTVRISQNEPKKLRASNDVPDEREMNFIRPERPFNLAKYLSGEDMWSQGRNIAKKGKLKSPPRELSALQALPPWGHKEPSAVGSIPPRPRKRHKVPDNNVEYYRSVSKRKIMPGEMLSESDDEMDDDNWAARKQRMRSPPIAGKSMGAFFDLYDNFIYRERVSSDVHLTDAIVRFCRKYQQKLRQPLMYHDFQLKLQQLILTGLISHRVQEYCEGLLGPISDTVELPLTNGTDGSDVVMVNGQVNGTASDTPRLPPPEQVPGAHPLTGHPKIKPYFGPLALHPEIQTQLTNAMLDPSAMEQLKVKAARLLAGRSNEELIRDEYPRWVAALAAVQDASQGREGRQCYPGRVVVTAGTCVCGRAAAQDRGTIMCANGACKKAEFHLACVNVKSRRVEWKCKDCSGRSTEWVG
ncbi:hypothetical protein K461DRAFT_310625 [Myriangium duriaei CBS 260.36]|uniref:Zinc finger PHD-type domain-containing protein n=1 Tax=Myriangium duriaei CBS 260.36 TaxID=1168546 RepID=A0A9P4MIL0_9PEZI|nr:hypothetical protein K461DRAFT_310625 [Myriangium duriaei CBS 260.36]